MPGEIPQALERPCEESVLIHQIIKVSEMSNKNDIVTYKELQNDERLSDYLRGNMTKDGEAAFFDDLKSDKEQGAQAVSIAYLSKATKEIGEKNDNDVKEALLSISQDDASAIAANAIRHAKAKPLRRKIVAALSIAASIIVLCAVGVQYYNYSYTTGLADQYSSTISIGRSLSRGQEEESTYKELSSLFNNVKSGNDLDTTIKRLSVLWELSTMETYNDYTDYSTDIGWNLAIAYLKGNDGDNAKTVLTRLISITEDGSAINTKAKELKHKIK